jgi:hypothetical protein
LAAAPIALAGCGGSSSKGTLTKDQLASKVNAACLGYSTALTKLRQPADFFTNPVAAAAFLDKLKPLIDKEYADVKSLKAPSSVKADFDAFVAAAKHQLDLAHSAISKAHARDPGGLRDIQAAAAYKKSTITPLAERLGFTSCL